MENVKYFPEGKGTSTPWGPAQYRYKLAHGVNFYGTASHGGLAVAPGWAAKHLSPEAYFSATSFQGGKLWFEEDCDCCVVFYEHPELWRGMTNAEVDVEEQRGAFLRSVQSWNAHYFDDNFRQAARKARKVPASNELASFEARYLYLRGWVEPFVLHGYGGRNNRHLYVTQGPGRTMRLGESMMMDRIRKIEDYNHEVVWERPKQVAA